MVSINRRKRKISSRILKHTCICLLITIFINLYWKDLIFKKPVLIKPALNITELINIKRAEAIPTLARVIYLIICENQAEFNAYANVLPSITADVIFFCWKKNCDLKNFFTSYTFRVSQWSKDRQFVRFEATDDYREIQSRAWLINEYDLNLAEKTTWTMARNLLLEKTLEEENRQGWRWAYLNFADGDIQLQCPSIEKYLKTGQTNGDEEIIAKQFRAVAANSISNNPCFILFDTCLLATSAALGVVSSTSASPISEEILTQLVYYIEGMLVGIHRDAVPYVLPYCSKYDQRSWWAGQVIFIYRSLCLYGHVVQFNVISMNHQVRRSSTENNDPWAIENDINLIPLLLTPLQKHMQQTKSISPLVLQHYRGWTLESLSQECRQNHASMHPYTCKNS